MNDVYQCDKCFLAILQCEIAEIVFDLQEEALPGQRYSQQMRQMATHYYCNGCSPNVPKSKITFRYVSHLDCNESCCNPFYYLETRSD